MIQQATPLTNEPRISSNELAKYPFETRSEKIKIVRDQKYPPTYKTVYYQKAEKAILSSFNGVDFDNTLLETAILELQSITPKHQNEKSKTDRNLHVLENFQKIRSLALPPTGIHTKKPKKAFLKRNGVFISVRPEIITIDSQTGEVAFTKIHYTKKPYSADSAEVLLYLLLEYGKSISTETLHFSLEKSKLIDCENGTIITGTQVSPGRERQADAALIEIAKMWPELEPLQKHKRSTKLAPPEEIF